MMYFRTTAFLFCIATAVIPSSVSLPAAEPARLTIHVDRPGPKVSPMLYGIFFEEINRAGDGGLYAEMLQNRSFEDDRGDKNRPAKSPGWTLVKSLGAQASMAIDSSLPLNPKNPNSLKLDIARIPSPSPLPGGEGNGRAGVANEGFRGIAVRKDAMYAFSVYLRSQGSFQGPVTISLEEADGRVLGSAKIEGVDTAWKKFECTLTATTTSSTARLVLALTPNPSPSGRGVRGEGTLWIDQASLFPKDTWKGRANGLRPDLADMLKGMRPAFVRFPGGCYVEGDRLANAFRWKNEHRRPGPAARPLEPLGLPFDRRPGLSRVPCRCAKTWGLEPLFVINCGMSHEEQGHKGVAKVPDLAEYLQDALDAIEYANGPIDSRWGALRAKAGHPAPFRSQVHGDRQREQRPDLRQALPALLRRHQGQVPPDEPGGRLHDPSGVGRYHRRALLQQPSVLHAERHAL